MRRLLIIPCALLAGGCVSHRAQALPPDGPTSSAVVGSRAIEPFTAPAEEQGSLPSSLPVTAWRTDEDGNLFRGDLVIETPLPWWQRFPADAVTDVVVPRTLEASRSGTPVLLPVPAADPVALTAHARTAGYAAPAKADQP